MPVTLQQLENIANTTLQYHMDKGKIHSQTLQNKPLLAAFRQRQRTFPGGEKVITVRVKGEYTTGIEGYEYDDEVGYDNPANVRKASFPWKEIHGGIAVTYTELKENGITISNTVTGTGESNTSRAELVQLANLFRDKLEDMTEGVDRGMNEMFWKDGSQDAKQVPGVQSIIVNDPEDPIVVGGIDQGANSWWRNRAALGINVTAPSDQVLAQTLQREYRQLRRYGNPRHLWLAGSDFLDALERELRAKGDYTSTGWANQGRLDLSVADLAFKGNEIIYDPTLDDMGLEKYLYVIDTKSIFPMVMEGEDMKRHTPARPENIYALYRAVTWTGGLVCRQRNTSGVYSIA